MIASGKVVGFCSSNQHKFTETQACIQALCPHLTVVQVVPKTEVAETGTSFKENALIKLHAALDEVDLNQYDYLLAEDAGFVVDALDGLYNLSPFPGIYSSRWLTSERQVELLGTTVFNNKFEAINQAILKLMAGKTGRNASYVSQFVVWCRETSMPIKFYEGRMQLEVAEIAIVGNGFGYDPIVRPLGACQSVSQISSEAKNAISHRNQAITAWLADLN